MRIVNLAIGILIVLANGAKLSVGAILSVVPYAYLLVRTILAGGTKELHALVYFIMMLMVMDVFFLRKKEWLLSLVDSLNFLTIINFIFIVKYIGQGGLFTYSSYNKRYTGGNYFLGYDNGFIVVYIFLIILNFVLYYYSRKKMYLLMVIVQIVSEIMVFSACTLVILISFGALIVLSKLKIIGRVIRKPILVISCYLGLTWLIVVLRIQEYLNTILYQIFGKDMESVRMNLWLEGIDSIKEYFWLGQGFKIGKYGIKTYGVSYPSAHNAILECMGDGGVLLFVLFSVLFLHAFKILCKNYKLFEANLIYCGIIAFMIGFIAEGYGAYTSFWLFLSLFLIGTNINKFHKLMVEIEFKLCT